MTIKNFLQKTAIKALGLNQLAAMWQVGRDLPTGGDASTSKPYAQVELVYACVNELIKAMVGLDAYLGNDRDDIIETGPLYDLLFRNTDLDFQRFVTETIGHFALSRDVFWIFDDSLSPEQITVVNGSQMHPITTNGRADGELVGWKFRGRFGRDRRFDVRDLWQWKNFNPYDRFHGLGPAQAAKLSIDYSYAASLYNKSALANGAEPGAIILMDAGASEEDVKRFRAQFDSRHKGPANTKKTSALTGVKDIKTIAMDVAKMEVDKLSQRSDKKICSDFGVPPELLGLATEAQYAHGPAQQRFIFNTVIPLAAEFAGQVNAGIAERFAISSARGTAASQSKLFAGRRQKDLNRIKAYTAAKQQARKARQGIFLWFDTDSHPTVQESIRERTKDVLEHTRHGIPLNQIIEKNDLPYDTVEWGDDWWIGMGQVPARFTLEAGTEGIADESLPEGGEPEGELAVSAEAILKRHGIGDGPLELAEDKKEKADRDRLRELRLWNNWKESWRSLEREYQEAIRKFFLRQQRILLEKLESAVKGKSITKEDPDEIVARVVFDLKTEDGKIKAINQTFFSQGSELGIRQLLSELGFTDEDLEAAVEAAMRRPAIKRAITISSRKIANVNRTTQDMVARLLSEGLEAGEDLDTLTRRIKTALGTNRSRAQSIARTQTAGAVNTGRQEGMNHAGVKKKRWVTSGDSEVRRLHRDAGYRYREGIPVDQPFVLGGDFLMYPGDPNGSAANIINCRCVQVSVKGDGKGIGENHQFYSYEDMKSAREKENGS